MGPRSNFNFVTGTSGSEASKRNKEKQDVNIDRLALKRFSWEENGKPNEKTLRKST